MRWRRYSRNYCAKSKRRQPVLTDFAEFQPSLDSEETWPLSWNHVSGAASSGAVKNRGPSDLGRVQTEFIDARIRALMLTSRYGEQGVSIAGSVKRLNSASHPGVRL